MILNNRVKKICKKCKIKKEINLFGKNKIHKDGLNLYCKECIKEKNNSRKEYRKEWVRNNPDKVREVWEKYQKTDKSKKYQKDYLKNNKEKILKYKRKYRKNNIDKRRSYENDWKREKRKNDPYFKLKENLRHRFYNSIKKNKKFKSIIKIIGCTIEELKIYLEKQFLPEMNWDNHGMIWEIDHIKPIYNFNLTKLSEQKKCFHYTNMRPLFSTTDIAKQFGYKDQIGNRNKNKY